VEVTTHSKLRKIRKLKIPQGATVAINSQSEKSPTLEYTFPKDTYPGLPQIEVTDTLDCSSLL